MSSWNEISGLLALSEDESESVPSDYCSLFPVVLDDGLAVCCWANSLLEGLFISIASVKNFN
jgi:hypothetical protein